MNRRIAQIAVKQGIGYNTVKPEQFFEKPRDERVRLIMEHKVLFYDEAGVQVPTKEALQLLKAQR